MLFLETLFEDEDLVAINKPSGLPSHSLPQTASDQLTERPTVESILRARFPQIQAAHRLDTGTSGVLMLSKNPIVYNELRKLFQLKLLQKKYWAWVQNAPQTQAALERISRALPFRIDYSLGHHPKSSKRMVVIDPQKSPVKNKVRGKAFSALTWIEHIENELWQQQAAFKLTVKIETGVTHQIRAHLAHLGLPILGDPIYQKTEPRAAVQDSEPHQRPRLGLHARSLEFTWRDQLFYFEAPVPPSKHN